MPQVHNSLSPILKAKNGSFILKCLADCWWQNVFIALSVSSSDLATNSWCLIIGSWGTSQAMFRYTHGVLRTHLAPRFGQGLWAFTRQTFTGKLSPCSTTSECYLREFYPKFKTSFKQHLNSDKSMSHEANVHKVGKYIIK